MTPASHDDPSTATTVELVDAPAGRRIRIWYNTNITMSRGKLAAHAAHAVLNALGVHPGVPIVVLGAKPREILKLRTVIHDHGRTELEPGTLTTGTDWAEPTADQVTLERIAELVDELDPTGKVFTRDYATSVRVQERKEIVTRLRQILSDAEEVADGEA
ncbi:hypothetical protein [Agromyces humi]|uniref:hypothetical protein n=1 Tax=Agromyces humi TaxID=1766800 RepID=UPI00135ADB0B|nr:hypothetical protein [Agromyces humi]